MGQAKARREGLRAAMMRELERWASPPSKEEAQLLKAVEALPFRTVERLPDDQLAYMRMEPQQCHANAAAYARLDPTRRSRQVSGWWRRGPMLFFHSVVETQGQLACITPSAGPRLLEFAEDPEIAWHAQGEVMQATRGGLPVPYVLREDPERVLRVVSEMKSALASGADPMQVTLDFETFTASVPPVS